MAATDATCQGDVRKLARFFETLGASSKESRKPFSSGTRRSADSGPYTPVELMSKFRGAVAGGEAPLYMPLSRPYNEGYHVNSKRTVADTPVDFSSKYRGPVAGGDAPFFRSLSRPYSYEDYPVDFLGPVAGKDERPCVPCSVCSKEHPPYSDCPYVPCDVCYKVHHIGNCPYFNHLPRGATFDPCYEIVCECGNEFNEDKWACIACRGSRPVLTLKYCNICNTSKDHSSHECPNDEVRAAEFKLNRDLLLYVGPSTIPYDQVYVPTPPPGFVDT